MKFTKSLLPAVLAVSTMGAVHAVAQDADAMLDEWEAYLDTAKSVSQQLRMNQNSVQRDPVGLIDIMTGFMRTNFDNAMSSSATSFRGRPRFNAFDDPNTRIGIDNPDTRYLGVHIPNGDGQQIYRVWGNRSNSKDMIHLTNDATNPMGGGATLEDEDMVNLKGKPLKKNQDFEIFFSTAELYEPSYMLNWLEIGSTDGLNISSRYTVCNYKKERPGDIAVERMGTKGVVITPEEFRNVDSMRQGIGRAVAGITQQQPFWGTFGDFVRNSGLPPNTIVRWAPTGGLGITTQLSFTSYVEIADDEALVVSYRTDLPTEYASLQMHNDWGSSLPWGHAPVNMSVGCDGKSNSKGTDDGFTHLVISKEDPGVHNWITTMGFDSVFMSGRLQGFDPAFTAELQQPFGPWAPVTQIVKLVDLPSVLPSDTKYVNANKRAKQIAERQEYQRDKYGNFW